MTVWTGIDRGPLSAGPVDLSPPTGIPLRHRRLTAACVFFLHGARSAPLRRPGTNVAPGGRRGRDSPGGRPARNGENSLAGHVPQVPAFGGGRGRPAGGPAVCSRPSGLSCVPDAGARVEGRASCPPSFRTDRTEASTTMPSRRGGGTSLPTWTREQGKRPDPLLSSAIHASCCQPKFADMAAALGDTHLPLAGICWSARLPGRTYAPPLAQSSLPDVPPRAAMRTTCHAGG